MPGQKFTDGFLIDLFGGAQKASRGELSSIEKKVGAGPGGFEPPTYYFLQLGLGGLREPRLK